MTPEQLKTYMPQQISKIFQQREHVRIGPYAAGGGSLLQSLGLFQAPLLNISKTSTNYKAGPRSFKAPSQRDRTP